MTPRADLEVLQRVVRESGVDQNVPRPAWPGYARALAEAFSAWVERWFPRARGLHEIGGAIGAWMTVAAAVLVLAVLAFVVRAVLQTRRRRRAAGAASPPYRVPAAAGPPERDRGAWRREIEGRLGAGDLSGALEALWWWFARAVSDARVDPAWTSRELLAHANRPDLAPLAVALDRLLYGAERPGAEAIRRFLRRGEEALA